ncbi:MAG: RidA family protein [Chloroflexi bacterium]|nr:RidA family protein [Chloroflexota bacterium]
MPKTRQREVIIADKAPKAIGPYSQGIRYGDLVFTAGQLGLDYKTGQLVEGGIEAQTRQVLNNLKSILEASGSSLTNVIKTTVFVANMAEFEKMNAIYAEFFSQNPPARTTVQAAGLPRGAAVEIECVAMVGVGKGD